eukprot:CCRYP_002449-RA/>CCRYP_002449-RA protein AED:0.07 eAED:0.07 QI:88/0.5/0.33/1/1/1/3/0/376
MLPYLSVMLHLLSIRAASSLMLRSLTCRTRHHVSTGLGVSKNRCASDTWCTPSLMEHMLYRIRECNKIPDDVQQCLIDFQVDGKVLGKVTPKVADRLCSTPSASSESIFELSQSASNPFPTSSEHVLKLTEAAGHSLESRTAAVASVMKQLHNTGYITGWRDEMYPVAECFDEVSKPVFLIERAAASLLGVLEYGVHVNGLVLPKPGENSDVKMWMARRSKLKSKFPGLLDHIVAGGQPSGLSLMENVVKECFEEAGIPPRLTQKGVKPAGAISYTKYCPHLKNEDEGVMNRVVLFCFDLILPEDFIPQVNDGEVESFFTWRLDDIARSMDPDCSDPIKPNCYLVIIDYLIRSGAVSPDCPKYLEVLRTLRSGTCA